MLSIAAALAGFCVAGIGLLDADPGALNSVGLTLVVALPVST